MMFALPLLIKSCFARYTPPEAGSVVESMACRVPAPSEASAQTEPRHFLAPRKLERTILIISLHAYERRMRPNALS